MELESILESFFKKHYGTENILDYTNIFCFFPPKKCQLCISVQTEEKKIEEKVSFEKIKKDLWQYLTRFMATSRHGFFFKIGEIDCEYLHLFFEQDGKLFFLVYGISDGSETVCHIRITQYKKYSTFWQKLEEIEKQAILKKCIGNEKKRKSYKKLLTQL